jgi:hypothetical protein
MKSILMALIIVFVLLICNSCDVTNPSDSEYDLKGTIKDSEGNMITDASVYIDFGWTAGEERDSSYCDLSSLTVIVTSDYVVRLDWVTQAESGLLGFNLYRSEDNVIAHSIRINPSPVPATNTSSEQAYHYNDYVVELKTYCYWLEAVSSVGESEFWGPVMVVDPPIVPPIWSFPCAYPNPSDSYTTLPFTVTQASHISLKISSSYLGEVRTLCDENLVQGLHRMLWDGKDNNGNKVCNGVYQAKLTAKSETDSIRFQKTIVILINDVGFNNRPATLSTSSGYRIPLDKYFQFGTEVIQTDEMGNELGAFEIGGEFDICIKKEGYETVTRHVSLSSFTHEHKEDFTLYPGK